VISLCKASLNIMVRSWWKTASVAIVKVEIFKLKAMVLLGWVMRGSTGVFILVSP